ncbi:hypothetical protein EON83_26410 [bacterium]|nr:MAG: hypothetical protein EON83_26410 [bacterium]
MTEQEAEVLVAAWAARLTRIWNPEKVVLDYVVSPLGFFDYRGEVGPDITFVVDHDFGDINFYLHLDAAYSQVALKANKSQGLLDLCNDSTRELFEARQPILDEWTPFFRRGCWLSGFPIEATAHEKMEWIRGFTREEIEAWNLKM